MLNQNDENLDMTNDDEKCKTCGYYHPLKKFKNEIKTYTKNAILLRGHIATSDSAYTSNACCLFHLYNGGGPIYETIPTDICECYKRREECKQDL